MRGLVSQALVASLMLLPSNFDTLLNYFSVAAWVFYFITVAVVLILRWQEPARRRPFRVWTAVPVAFCAISFMLVVSLVVLAPWESVVALGFILSAVPVFYLRPWLARHIRFVERE